MTLPSEVIATDHNLEQVADKASGQLAQHRWHWTLDESNLQRAKSVMDYARQVGRSYSLILAQVNGYQDTVTDQAPGQLASNIERRRLGAETAAAAGAVASARNLTPGGGSMTARREEVRRVRDISRQLAEERGTSIEDEAPKVAETIVRHERAQQTQEAERLERSDIRFVEMEGYLVKAKRELLKALKLAPNVPWDDESRELLSETVGNVKALLGLIDTALSGASGVDWDAEWIKAGGGNDSGI